MANGSRRTVRTRRLIRMIGEILSGSIAADTQAVIDSVDDNCRKSARGACRKCLRPSMPPALRWFRSRTSRCFRTRNLPNLTASAASLRAGASPPKRSDSYRYSFISCPFPLVLGKHLFVSRNSHKPQGLWCIRDQCDRSGHVSQGNRPTADDGYRQKKTTIALR